MSTPGCQQVLLKNDEELIVEAILYAADSGFPFERGDIKLLVKNYLDRNGKQVGCFKQNMTRLSENIKRSRAEVFHAELNEYFDNLEVILANVSPDHLVNYDETNFVDVNDCNYLHESSGSEYVANDSASVIEESNYEDQNENIQPESEDHKNGNHLPINNESLTSRDIKRIKSFPVKQKTAKNRIRDPESWKKNAAAMCREKGKGSISYKGNVPP
jgi:hypothetical protein